jgi:GDP-4-dehydro-6-deoxy-D-mannose reductase
MRVLITGIGGFAGRHLARLLLSENREVFGTVRRPEAAGVRREAFPQLTGDRLRVADVTEAEAVARVVAEVQPDAIIHLAGWTFVPDSHADPAAVFRSNALGTLHVFAAVHRHRARCRVVAVGSADAYGLLDPSDLPVRETCAFRPISPYGASKAAADLLGHQWSRGYGLDVVRVRPFNHIGPGQRSVFVCPDFAQQIAAIERGRWPAEIEVGTLDVVRDFTDVRDVVAAYVAAMDGAEAGEAYNICTGVGHTVREMLQTLIELGDSSVAIKVVPERVRKTDVPSVIGSFEKLRARTGWTPRHSLRQTLADVLAEQRALANKQ